MQYLGDFPADQAIYFMWSTNDADGASVTRTADGTISVYKDNSDGSSYDQTQVTTGVTNDEDVDGLTGVHSCCITTTDAWYEVSHDYTVVLSGSTVDAQSVNAVLAHFSIENRSALRPTTTGRELDVSATGEAGLDFNNIKDATGAHTLTNITVPAVTTTTTNTDMVSEPPTAAAVVNEWESQSQTDPTGFHVNVKEVNGTAQTANDNGADINAILVDTSTTLQAELDAIQAAVITNAAGADIAADIIALKAETANILTDTAEIGAAGAGLTNINLPNQTMDITGNLSGSVGSVSGAIGSVGAGGINNASFNADVGSTAYATNIIALAADKAILNYDAPTKAELDTAESNIITQVDANETKIDTLTTNVADVPTVAEFEARTIVAADYVVTSDTIATVTNLTNAPTNGDLTAAMKTSVNTEVDSALNTAIPGAPTAHSINERIKATDDKLPTNYIMGSAVQTDKDDEIDAIKAKTDNLPADPASETNVDANETKIATVDTVVDAIKAVTDNLPNSGAMTDIDTGVNNLESRVPDTISLANINAEVDTAIETYHLDHLLAVDYNPASKPGIATALLNELVEDDGGISRYTANALEQAPTGGTTPQILVDTTIAVVNTQTSFTLTAGSNDDDAYNDQAIVLYDASDSDYPSVRMANDYVQATKTITIDNAPDFTIVAGDGVKIFVTAPGTTAPTASQVADAVLQESIDDHKAVANSLAEHVDEIEIDTSTTLENHLTDVKGTGFVKDTDSLVDLVHQADNIDGETVLTALKAILNFCFGNQVRNGDTITIKEQDGVTVEATKQVSGTTITTTMA